jgi:hypothetical protein
MGIIDPDDYEISIHPAPGTCCPEMRIRKNGRCKGCGSVHDTSTWGTPCKAMIDRVCCFDQDIRASPGCFGRLDCEGYEPVKVTP